jgi:hypothetical protein
VRVNGPEPVFPAKYWIARPDPLFCHSHEKSCLHVVSHVLFRSSH